MLNKCSGDMYPFVTHTINFIKGRCYHDCGYCYMKAMAKRFKKELPAPYLALNELSTNLCKDKTIFVGSGTDMWAQDIKDMGILLALAACREYPDNTYLFQSKDPLRFLYFKDFFPKNTILCTTVETNKNYKIDYPEMFGKAPDYFFRLESMAQLSKLGFKTMITVEPIVDFIPILFPELIKNCNPAQVNIGADTGSNHLPEPSKEKVFGLISALESAGIRVFQKKNLGRLLK